MDPVMKLNKNQKKSMKRAQRTQVAKLEAQHAEALLELEARKMLFATLECATSKIARHDLGALQFEARKMLFPSWGLDNTPAPSIASVPAFVAPTVVADAASDPVSDYEASLGSKKSSIGFNSPSSQSSVSVEDIEDVPVLLKTAASPLPAVEMATQSNADIKPKSEAWEPRHPILRRQFAAAQREVVESTKSKVEVPEQRSFLRHRFREDQLEQARNPTELTLEDVPYLLPGWGRMSLQEDFFNAAMLPKFAKMRPSLLNLGASFTHTAVVSRSLMSPLVFFTPPVKAPVECAQTKDMTDENVPPTKVVEEVILEPEVFENYSAPMVPIDPRFSDTENETEEFNLFGSPESLSEIDSSFSDSEDGHQSYFHAIVPKKAKKAKEQADGFIMTAPVVFSAAEADNVFPEASKPIPVDDRNANVPREIDVREITIMSAQCAIGGALFIAGCAGIGALVARALKK
ncbi:hypothetical protein EG328_010867 [Venturia inaequalis]|uniref:Uncharacterized protein n=1 Tax=Venturia inaequalis TaxID=5025 RepID=A0A8H3V7J5_VENIN|nr:hypothetical protein EG328_010867 [Venturia inaequalis]